MNYEKNIPVLPCQNNLKESNVYSFFLVSFSFSTCRRRPTHSSETEDEDDEPFLADAECGAAQRESPEDPGRGGAAGVRGQGDGQTGEETVEW